jgi:hypothetical protein
VGCSTGPDLLFRDSGLLTLPVAQPPTSHPAGFAAWVGGADLDDCAADVRGEEAWHSQALWVSALLWQSQALWMSRALRAERACESDGTQALGAGGTGR